MGKRRINRRRRARKQRRILLLAGIAFACILIIYGIISLLFYRSLSKTEKAEIYQGIYVGRTNVSGLKKKEAVEKVNAQFEKEKSGELTFKAGEKEEKVKYEELGISLANVEKAVDKAVAYGKKGNIWGRYFKVRKLKKEKKVFDITYRTDEEQAKKLLEKRVLPLLDHATDASIRRENGEFVVEAEKSGVTLDVEGTMKKIEKFLNGKWDGKNGTLKAVSKEHNPKVKASDLETIKDKLGTFKTYCGSGQSRVTNIENGTRKINGSVIMPGEEFSAGDAMRPLTKDNGYVEAGAYENGKVVQDIAGGICQVSTTLYNAVINAELEITSRQPHSMVVGYVKPSRDAAIAGDYKDLKFKNNLETPVYIEGYVSDGYVVFSIYGKETREEGREIEFVSETLETTEAPREYKVSKSLPLGETNTTGNPHDGVKAQLWKVVKENGKEVSRKVFNKSTYNSSPLIVEVGIKTDNSEAAAVIKEAVATQNKEKVSAAISKAKEIAAASEKAEEAEKKEE